MAHEIGSPLTAILGYADLLMLEKDNTPKQTHFLANVLHAGARIQSLTTDFSDVSDSGNSAKSGADTAFSITTFVAQVRAMVEIPVHEKTLELRTEIDPTLPEMMLGDEPRLYQVLLNLLTNAIKFTNAGSITMRVMRGGPDGTAVRFEVADTGIGIDTDNQKLIFSRGAQAKTTVHNNCGGSGLGLAISAEFIKRMGGRIGVQSELGCGSTFWFVVALRGPSAPREPVS